MFRIATPTQAFLREEGGGEADGRSLRDLEIRSNLIVTHSPSVTFGDSSLPEGAFVTMTSCASSFCHPESENSKRGTDKKPKDPCRETATANLDG